MRGFWQRLRRWWHSYGLGYHDWYCTAAWTTPRGTWHRVECDCGEAMVVPPRPGERPKLELLQ